MTRASSAAVHGGGIGGSAAADAAPNSARPRAPAPIAALIARYVRREGNILAPSAKGRHFTTEILNGRGRDAPDRRYRCSARDPKRYRDPSRCRSTSRFHTGTERLVWRF